MKKSALLVAVAVMAILPACGKKKVPPPPPPPPPVAPATPPPAPPPGPEVNQVIDDYTKLCTSSSDEIDRMHLLQEIHFDFDKYDLRDSDRSMLNANAENLKKFDFLKVKIEGHCDERGTVEYNLALGDKRARAAYDYLVSLGVPADRMSVVSFGKEIPSCSESTEDCWARNRRAHFSVTGKVTTERCR